MSALKVTSSILPAPLNNISVPGTAFESKTPGGLGTVTGPAINLNSLGVPATVASGSLVPVKLSSAVETWAPVRALTPRWPTSASLAASSRCSP